MRLFGSVSQSHTSEYKQSKTNNDNNDNSGKIKPQKSRPVFCYARNLSHIHQLIFGKLVLNKHKVLIDRINIHHYVWFKVDAFIFFFCIIFVS